MDHKNFGPMLDTFVDFASNELGIKSLPKITIHNDNPSSFGGYNPATKELLTSTKNRHPMDIFRTVAHELIHHKQNEDGKIGMDIAQEGSDGSDIENEANSMAGVIMRKYAKKNPQHFKLETMTEGYLVEGVNDPGIFKAVFLAGGPGCFHGNTKILMENGITKDIKDVNIGDILSNSDVVHDVFEYDATKKMVEVYFDDGTSVICTEDHEFLIDGKWIEAKNLI